MCVVLTGWVFLYLAVRLESWIWADCVLGVVCC